MAEITIFVAFVAGILSFLSPCILPLVPAFIAYISGVSIDQIKSNSYKRAEIFSNSVLFVLGFSAVFSVLGIVVNTIFSGIAYDFRIWLGRVGGAVVILFGLQMLNVLKLPFLGRERKFAVKRTKFRHLTSVLFGAAFAAGWTPCIGTILGAVLAIAITQPVDSLYLLFAYSLGLGMPFLLVGMFTAQASEFINKSGRFMRYFSLVAGIFLVAIGILVFTNQLSAVANFVMPAGLLAKG